MSFSALTINENEENIALNIEEKTIDTLSQGEVVIQVAYSSVNYKDSLAVKPNGGVIRTYPMIP